MDATNGTSSKTNGMVERCTGLRAIAARNLGLGEQIPKAFPFAVLISDHSPDAEQKIRAEVLRIAARAGEKRAATYREKARARLGWKANHPELPEVETLPEEYLADCVREVVARQERIMSEAAERVENLKALLKVGS